MAERDPPLVAGSIHGLRVWDVTYVAGQLRLCSTIRESIWESDGEPTTARCGIGGRHRPPAPDCMCGIYALHPASSGEIPTLHHALRGLGDLSPLQQCAGVVEAWGKVEVHRDGFRAEEARPRALFALRSRSRTDFGSAIRRLGRTYRAEVVEVDAAEDIRVWCTERNLGLDPSAVRDLLREPDEVHEAKPDGWGGHVHFQGMPRPRLEPTRRAGTRIRPRIGIAHIGHMAGRLGLGVLYVLWGAIMLSFWGGIAALAVYVGIETVNGDFFDDGVRQAMAADAGALGIANRAVLPLPQADLRVTLVKNTNESEAALGVHLEGARPERGPGRDRYPGTDSESGVNIAPGGTGALLDWVGKGAPQRAGEAKLRSEARAFAELGPDSYPLRIAGVRMKPGPCRAVIRGRTVGTLYAPAAMVVGRERGGPVVGAQKVPLVSGRPEAPAASLRLPAAACEERVRLDAYPLASRQQIVERAGP